MSSIVKAGEVVIHCGHVGDGRKKDIHWLEVEGGMEVSGGGTSHWAAICEHCFSKKVLTPEGLLAVLRDDMVLDEDMVIDTTKAMQ